MKPSTEPFDVALARVAYRGYGETTDFKNFQGNPMPEFDALPEKIRQAWANAVLAVINHQSGIDTAKLDHRCAHGCPTTAEGDELHACDNCTRCRTATIEAARCAKSADGKHIRASTHDGQPDHCYLCGGSVEASADKVILRVTVYGPIDQVQNKVNHLADVVVTVDDGAPNVTCVVTDAHGVFEVKVNHCAGPHRIRLEKEGMRPIDALLYIPESAGSYTTSYAMLPDPAAATGA